MTTSVDQKTYLQKYLSGSTGDKKKKRKKNLKGKGFKIIDDDLDLSKLRPLDGDELDILNEGEDAPQIAGIIDERPEELKKLDVFKSSSKWRVINQDDGFNSKLTVEEVKRSVKEVEKENEIVFGKMYSDSEDEKKNDSDASPPRRSDSKKKSKSNLETKHQSHNAKSKNYDSDVSPPRKNSNAKVIVIDDSPPTRKHVPENSKLSQNKYDSKHSKMYQNDSDENTGRRYSQKNRESNKSAKKESSDRQRVRKPSRWGEFKEDNMRQRSESPQTSNRSEKRKSSPARSSQSYKNLNDSNQINYDSDISPPRKSRRDSSKRYKYNPNISPSRKRLEDKLYIKNNNRNGKYKELSPKTSTKYSEESSYNKRRHESHSDSSPRQEKRKNYDKRNNTEQRKRNDSDADSSPRQEKRKICDKRNNTDRRKRNDSDSDSSPRQEQRKNYDKRNHRDQRKRNDSDSDSPPRQEKKNYYDKRNDTDQRKRNDNDSDSSPRQEKRKYYDKRNNTDQRKRNDSDSDLSPPRKERRIYSERREHRRNVDEPPPTNKKMEKTLEGKQAGLQDANQLKQENESFRRREDEVFKNMTDEMSGRNAQIVSRKNKRETSEDRQKKKDKAERQKELDEKYKKWSKGLKQIESQQAAVEDFIHEASKPLARYKDDTDLESKLRDVERQGDPMLKYMREKKRERGEMGPEKPTYKGNFAPNRFNIRPGYRWDGVDRSNGYEMKYFEQKSKRKAQEEELYKWNTEDL